MKRIVLALALIALPAASLSAAEGGAQALDDAFVNAFTAGNVDAVVALYAPDAVAYFPDVMEAKGTAAIRKVIADFHAQFSVKEFRLLDRKYDSGGALSVGWGRYSMTVIPKAGGQALTLEGRFTSVTKNVGGKWLYISDHASAPLPPPPAPAK